MVEIQLLYRSKGALGKRYGIWAASIQRERIAVQDLHALTTSALAVKGEETLSDHYSWMNGWRVCCRVYGAGLDSATM